MIISNQEISDDIPLPDQPRDDNQIIENQGQNESHYKQNVAKSNDKQSAKRVTNRTRKKRVNNDFIPTLNKRSKR